MLVGDFWGERRLRRELPSRGFGRYRLFSSAIWTIPDFRVRVTALRDNCLIRFDRRGMLQRHHLFERGWISRCCVVLLCLPIVGCSRDSLLKRFGYDRASLLKKQVPADDEALALHSVDLLFQDRYGEIENSLDPSIRNADTHDRLVEMSHWFPSKPISVKTVEASTIRSRDSRTTSITVEYEFTRSWLLAQVVIRTKDGLKTITGVSVTPTAEPVEVMNEFTLDDKGFSQYAGLFLALWIATLTLYAFVLCARMKIGKKKWVWLVAILVGVCQLTVNWTTGEWFFTPLALNIPAVTASCTPYGPWMLHILSPLGAITFLQLRKRLVSVGLPPPEVPTAARGNEG